MTAGKGSPEHQTSGQPEPVLTRQIWRVRLGLLVLLGAAALAGILFGLGLVKIYPYDESSLIKGSLFATGGALLATLKELFGLGPGLVDYWKSGRGEGAWRFATFLFVSLTASAMAFQSKTNPSQIGVHLKERPQALFASPHEPSISVSFPEAVDSKVEGDSIKVRIKEELQDLVEGLLACSRPNGDGDSVRLLITGFSRSEALTDTENVARADKRALIVGQLLHEATGGESQHRIDGARAVWESSEEHFEIIARQWHLERRTALSFAAMREEGQFYELDDTGVFVRDKSRANRAKIHILKYGRCKLAYPRTYINVVEVR